MAPRSRAEELLPPSKLKERRRKKRVVYSVLWVVVLLLVLAGLVSLTHVEALRIHEVTVTGTQTISQSDLQHFVEEEIAGSYLWIIPKNSTFLYSAKAIEEKMLVQFPKLKEASIALENFHTLHTTVVERTPTALWCGSAGQAGMDSFSECYFIDETGYVYELATAYADKAYVRWFGALDNEHIPAHFLTEQEFHTLQLLVAALSLPSRTPVRVVVDENKDVFVRFAEGFEIRFTLEQKSEDVLALLSAALNSPALSGKKLSDLQYLDLRFGERLYYKFK